MEMGWVALGIVAFILLAIVEIYITKYKTIGPDETLIVIRSYLRSKNVTTGGCRHTKILV